MISHLKAVQQDIADNILEFNGMSVTLIYYISECIKEAIADADSHIINKAYLKENHGGEDGYLTKAKNCFYEIKADPSAKASFSEEIACLNPDTITWLLDAFDVDKDQLIK